MKKLLTPRRNLVLALCLGAWAGGSVAQSLGTPSAEAWIGRPLDMTVPARFLSPDAECVHADVFYGENRIRANQVHTSVVGGDAKRIRIQADALIDEPIVTVSVRAGCAGSITRNYTLLPELPSESVIAAWNRQAAARAVAAAPAAPLRMATTASSPTSPRVRAPRQVPAQVAAAVPSNPAPRMRAAKAPRQQAGAGPRLRLEPLEFEQQPLLRVSSNLADPAGNAAGRATAALLWQAINADPQEILRTSAMLQKLEADLLQLRLTNDQTRAEMAVLRGRLDESQSWHASPVLAQVLALLLLAAATAAGVLWFRGRREAAAQAAWYAPVDPSASGAVPEVAGVAPVPPPQYAPVPAVNVPRQAVADVPSPAVARGPIDFEVVAPVQAQPQRRPAVMRVETLAATFEEVEFLASLGLGKDAMDVLKAYLQDSASPAPVAFFELMRLCEQAGEPAGLAMVRRRYEKAFGVEAPLLAQLAAPAGLEGLPQLSARITQAWGRPEVVDILEEALFRVPEPGGGFTLQAGRELICLHDLATALAADRDTAPVGHGTDPHPLAPWADADDTASALAATQGSVGGEGGHHFALDFDLGAAPEALPPSEAHDQDARLAPLLAEMKANASRDAARRTREQGEDAFSEAVHSEHAPVSRF